MLKSPISALAASLLLASTASANLEVSFVESAPKDWFDIKNASNCDMTDVMVTIDLSASAGKLIFDTTGNGAGVQVFQPFEVRQGEVELVSSDEVRDGDTQLSVLIRLLAPGSSASFTIDVDDTVPSGALGMTMIAGNEIENALATVGVADGQEASGRFNGSGRATVPLNGC